VTGDLMWELDMQQYTDGNLKTGALSRTQTVLVGKFVLLFCGLHLASILAAPRLFATHYMPLSPTEQRDWHGRVVGSVFATGIVFLALPEYLWPGDALAADEAFGTSDRASLACAIAAAFFVWDVFFCTAACQGWPFVLHASAGLFIYWHALQPFQQRAACFFLCWEASTPLLNLRSQLIACRLTHTRTFSCANVGFAAAFLIIRWGFGMPGSVFWWNDSIALLRAGDPRLRPQVVFVTMAANLALNSLNVWWGSKVRRPRLSSCAPPCTCIPPGLTPAGACWCRPAGSRAGRERC